METLQLNEEAGRIVALFGDLSFPEKQQIQAFFQKPDAKRTEQEWLDVLRILETYLSRDDESLHLTRAHSNLARRFTAWKREKIEAAQQWIRESAQQRLSMELGSSEIPWRAPEGYEMTVGNIVCISIDGENVIQAKPILLKKWGETHSLIIIGDKIYESGSIRWQWHVSEKFSVNPETHQISIIPEK